MCPASLQWRRTNPPTTSTGNRRPHQFKRLILPRCCSCGLAHSALPSAVQYCVQSVGEYTTASPASSMAAFVSAGVLAAALQHGPQDLLKVVQGITIASTPPPPQVGAEMLGKRCTNLSQLKEDVSSTHPAYVLRNSVIQQYCLYRQAQHTAQHNTHTERLLHACCHGVQKQGNQGPTTPINHPEPS